VNTLSPARIMEVGMAFWPAKVLLSALELGLFTHLGANSMSGRELQVALELHPRANPDFFDTLVALRFLGEDPKRAIAIRGKPPCSSIATVRSSWAAFSRWPTPAFIDSRTISPTDSAPASRKMRLNTPARRCSLSCTASPSGSSNSWMR
jgi:hypothetical protein